jgi:hypothetical protein
VPEDCYLLIRQGAFGSIFIIPQTIVLQILWVFFLLNRTKELLPEMDRGARGEVSRVEGSKIFL